MVPVSMQWTLVDVDMIGRCCGWPVCMHVASVNFNPWSWYPGQLSLAIPLWVNTMSTGESWEVNRHTARCTIPVSVVLQCKLVSGWGLMKQRSAPPRGLYSSGRTLRFFTIIVSVSRGCSASCWYAAGKERFLVDRFCPSLNAVTICGCVASSWVLVIICFILAYTSNHGTAEFHGFSGLCHSSNSASDL